MSAGRSWVAWNPGDYHGDTAHLTTLEHGAYTLLLWTYWRTGPLADDDLILARIAKMTPTGWHRIGATIRAFFTVGQDARLHQKRMDQEFAKIAAVSKVRSRAARSKCLKSIEVVSANAPILHVQNASAPVVVDVPLGSTGEKKGKKGNRARASAPAVIGLPAWLPAADWTDFVAHRKASGYPLTDLAAQRAIKDLDKLRQDGVDVCDALNAAIVRNWRGIFDPRPAHHQRGAARQEITEQDLWAEMDRSDREEAAAKAVAAD